MSVTLVVAGGGALVAAGAVVVLVLGLLVVDAAELDVGGATVTVVNTTAGRVGDGLAAPLVGTGRLDPGAGRLGVFAVELGVGRAPLVDAPGDEAAGRTEICTLTPALTSVALTSVGLTSALPGGKSLATGVVATVPGAEATAD